MRPIRLIESTQAPYFMREQSPRKGHWPVQGPSTSESTLPTLGSITLTLGDQVSVKRAFELKVRLTTELGYIAWRHITSWSMDSWLILMAAAMKSKQNIYKRVWATCTWPSFWIRKHAREVSQCSPGRRDTPVQTSLLLQAVQDLSQHQPYSSSKEGLLWMLSLCPHPLPSVSTKSTFKSWAGKATFYLEDKPKWTLICQKPWCSLGNNSNSPNP